MPNNEPSTKNKILTPRKLTLLASVAVIGGAVLIAGLGNFPSSNFAATQPAQAAEPAAPVASTPTTAPIGFADLVAKVKPAVISVRVRVVELSMSSDGAADMPRSRPACRNSSSSSACRTCRASRTASRRAATWSMASVPASSFRRTVTR